MFSPQMSPLIFSPNAPTKSYTTLLQWMFLTGHGVWFWHVASGTWSRCNSPGFFVWAGKSRRRLACTLLSLPDSWEPAKGRPVPGSTAAQVSQTGRQGLRRKDGR